MTAEDPTTCPRCGRRWAAVPRVPTPCARCRPAWERANTTWSGRRVPAPRQDLVAHVREQIAADAEGYANPAKLGIVARTLEGELRRDVLGRGCSS